MNNQVEEQIQEQELTPEQIKESQDREIEYLKSTMELWELRHKRVKLVAEMAHYQCMEMKAMAEMAHMQSYQTEGQSQTTETPATADANK